MFIMRKLMSIRKSFSFGSAIVFSVVVLMFSACSKTVEDEPAETQVTASAGDAAGSTATPVSADVGAVRDATFNAFLTKLQAASAKRDAQAMAPLMTTDFGYRIEPVGMGEGVFQHWDENNLWPELELVLKEKWVPLGNYLVAPSEFAVSPTIYSGYRAGCIKVSGIWKFAYFVSGR